MLYFIPVIFFALINIWLVFFGKRKFGESLPVTLMISTFTLYISQACFNTFNVGFYSLTIIACFAIVLLINKTKDLKFKARILSNGFWGYIVIFFMALIIDYGRHFTNWDELMHWGKMTQEMIRLDKFYTDPASELLVHRYYPPIVPIFEMLWCKLTGGWSEANQTMSLHFLIFAFIVPWLLERIELNGKKCNKVISALLVFLILIMIPLNSDGEGIFSTTYLDIFVSAIFAYSIALVFDKEFINTKFGYVTLIATMTMNVMAKQICVAFVGLTWFAYTLNIFIDDNMHWNFTKTMKKVFLSLGVILIPMINYLTWNHYTDRLGLAGMFDLDKIRINEFISILLGGGTTAQHTTYKNIVEALFSTTMTTGIFKLTYFSSFFVALGLLTLMYILFNGYFTKGEVVKTVIVFLCGRIGYTLTILILYMFCFSAADMKVLSGFPRYMSSYMCGEGLILVYWLVQLLKRKGTNQIGWKKLLIVLGSVVLLSDSTKLVRIMPQVFKGEPLYTYRNQAETIMKKTEEGSKIFLANSSSDAGKNMTYLTFYLEKRFLGDYNATNFSSVDITDTKFWQNVINSVKECDYLYIYDSCDVVNQILGVYADVDTFESGSLYKVFVNGELRLERIE